MTRSTDVSGRWRTRLNGVFVALVVGIFAVGGAVAAPFTAEDKADIANAEAYLNGLKTMQSRFVQVASDGSYAEGTLSLDRPGKMRIEYDPPSPVLVVADGNFLIYFDKDLQQVSHLGLDDTPAGLLLADKVSLSGKVTVQSIERRAGVLSIALANAKDPNEGRLTLVFSDKPLQLRKWIVTDQQGITTNFSLLSARFGLDLSPDLFKFTRPPDPERRD